MISLLDSGRELIVLRTRANISRVTGQLNLVVDGMAISLILGQSQQSSPFFHIYIIIFFVLFFFFHISKVLVILTCMKLSLFNVINTLKNILKIQIFFIYVFVFDVYKIVCSFLRTL